MITEVAEAEALRLGVSYRAIQIRDQRTRWGSCSPRGTLTFNWRLVLAPHAVLDYVVVHELCHLREANHGPGFWRLVEQARPGYKVPRAWLRRHGHELLGRTRLASLPAMAARWASFDCYGTLVDWDGGVSAQLERLFGAERVPRLLARYHEVEPVLQAEEPASQLSRRAHALARGARRRGGCLAERRGRRSRRARCRRGLRSPRCAARSRSCVGAAGASRCSRTPTRDFLDASLANVGVPVDLRVVASEIGSYKPARGHWDAFYAATGAGPARHVHVGASLFHDVVPCVGARDPLRLDRPPRRGAGSPRDADPPRSHGAAGHARRARAVVIPSGFTVRPARLEDAAAVAGLVTALDRALGLSEDTSADDIRAGLVRARARARHAPRRGRRRASAWATST